MMNRKLLRPGLIIRDFYRSKSKSTSEYCLDNVRRYDNENFICTLLLNNDARSTAFAVRGFNVEIARIGEQVSQETTGRMRLQFWDEAIEKCFANDAKLVPKHPVAIELYKAIQQQKLSKRHLRMLLKCRRDNFKLTGFTDLESTETYCEQSVSTIYYAILEATGVKNVNADHAASHLGKAQGLVQLLRSVPLAKQLNFMPYPQELLSKNNLSHEEVFRGTVSDRLNECTYEMASRAYSHLKKARSLMDNVPVSGRPALLPAAPVDHYLLKLQKVNYDPLHAALRNKSRTWMLKAWYNSIRNRY